MALVGKTEPSRLTKRSYPGFKAQAGHFTGRTPKEFRVPKELRTHKTNPVNEALTVAAIDEPGPGGAHHVYRIDGYGGTCNLSFQNGPINEVGTNGITNEALLAVVLDRLEAFQAGPYKCRENALAITKLEEAMHWLHHRTRLREQRGVEGTHQV